MHKIMQIKRVKICIEIILAPCNVRNKTGFVIYIYTYIRQLRWANYELPYYMVYLKIADKYLSFTYGMIRACDSTRCTYNTRRGLCLRCMI